MPELQRPALSRELGGAELLRWYWRKDELTAFARTLGVRATGSKGTVMARIASVLDDVPFTEPERTRSAAAQLAGPLTGSTLIPKGQRCSQIVRDWFVSKVGSSFAYDAAMRDFFGNSDGTRTLQDALDHYRATRGQRPKEIDAQFEYNRFTRAWHRANPGGSREGLLHAWRDYRDLPIDQRGRI